MFLAKLKYCCLLVLIFPSQVFDTIYPLTDIAMDTYGKSISLKLLMACLPNITIANWIQSSIKHPDGSHWNSICNSIRTIFLVNFKYQGLPVVELLQPTLICSSQSSNSKFHHYLKLKVYGNKLINNIDQLI